MVFRNLKQRLVIVSIVSPLTDVMFSRVRLVDLEPRAAPIKPSTFARLPTHPGMMYNSKDSVIVAVVSKLDSCQFIIQYAEATVSSGLYSSVRAGSLSPPTIVPASGYVAGDRAPGVLAMAAAIALLRYSPYR